MSPEEKATKLDKITSKKLVYEYDFGDGWEHDVVIERVDPRDRSRPDVHRG